MALVVLLSTGILAAVRMARIDSEYHPLVYILLSSGFHQLGDGVLKTQGYQTAMNDNIYGLLEFMLVTWQFYRWGLWRGRGLGVVVVVGVMITGWLVETIWRWDGLRVNSVFMVMRALVIILMSVQMFARVFYTQGVQLHRHPVFLVCLSFIIFYSYDSLVEFFWINGLQEQNMVRQRIFLLQSVVQLFTHLLLFVSFLWIPLKRVYSMPS